LILVAAAPHPFPTLFLSRKFHGEAPEFLRPIIANLFPSGKVGSGADPDELARMGRTGHKDRVLFPFNGDGLVKSPSAALRFNFVVAAHS
jgi:hypothetical protein